MRHRSAVLWATAAATVIAVAVVAWLTVLGPASDPVVAAPQDRPGPVLLVPGYGGATESLQVLAVRLRAAGREASVVPLPDDGTGDLRQAALALGAAVNRATAAGAPSVDLVGYSAGGVIARLWVAQSRAAGIRRVITLGSPHHGSQVAGIGAVLAPNLCPEACRQLVPGSDLLTALNKGQEGAEAGETVAGPQWLSLWTDVDEVVTPPVSARLDGAVNVSVQQLCPTSRVAHGTLPRDPLVTRVVLESLSSVTLREPQAGCRSRQPS